MGSTYAKAHVIICSSSFKKALRYHSQQGNKDILVQIILEGVDVNIAVDEDGHRPIHYIAKGNHRDCIKTILEHKGDINIQNNFGLTALHCACQKEHLHTIRELIDNGAKLDVKDRFGWTPLHYACKQGCASAIRILKERNADLNAVTKWDWTPVHVAARWGRSQCLMELLKDDQCIEHIMLEDQSQNTALDLGQIFADRQDTGPDVVQIMKSHLKPRVYENNRHMEKQTVLPTFKQSVQEIRKRNSVSLENDPHTDEIVEEKPKSKNPVVFEPNENDNYEDDHKEKSESEERSSTSKGEKRAKNMSTKPLKENEVIPGKSAEIIANKIAVREKFELDSEPVSVLMKAQSIHFEQTKDNQMQVTHPVSGWISLENEGQRTVAVRED